MWGSRGKSFSTSLPLSKENYVIVVLNLQDHKDVKVQYLTLQLENNKLVATNQELREEHFALKEIAKNDLPSCVTLEKCLSEQIRPRVKKILDEDRTILLNDRLCSLGSNLKWRLTSTKRSVDGVETPYPPTTVDEKFASKNELKARAINTAHGVSAASSKTNASNLPNVYSLSDVEGTMRARIFLQIDPDDLMEMDLKWQMVMLTMRAKIFLQKTGRNLGVKGTETIDFDKNKVECYNCYRRGHFSRECRASKHQDNKNRETTTRTVPVHETTSNALVS
nr:ribonuclease H-like domain-containing protein [Tanacetum cinerariifolium]